MKTPTIEEVRDYFKNAKTVMCISDKRPNNIAENIIEEINYDLECYWIRTEESNDGNGSVLLWEDGVYAEILTYIN